MEFKLQRNGHAVVKSTDLESVAVELTSKLLATGVKNIDYDEGTFEVFSYSPRDDFGNNINPLYHINISGKNSVYVQPLTDEAKSDLRRVLY
jgi:hypothetical protein